MIYKEYFSPYAREIDKFLARFFRSKIKHSAKITPIAAEMWQKLEEFIAGGKRIRGGLIKLGYECFGGKDQKAILPVSAAIEITHVGLLVHDDVIDQDSFRHNQPTIYKKYESDHKRRYHKNEPLHYGESMAICVGDSAFYAAIALIAQSDFPEEKKNKAINKLCHYITETAYGEALDVDLGCRPKISEKEVLLIHTLKTAKYTFVGPLELGGILGGAKTQELKLLEKYSLPVGIAFQLQDDILGMFGSVEKLGKPVDSDIKEGKNTLLYTQALKKGNRKQQKRLKQLWGEEGITPKEVEEAREIIKKTGSLEYSQKLARRLVEKGKKVVPKLTKNKELQEVFYSLADFIVEREK